jgi:hypothetical protein
MNGAGDSTTAITIELAGPSNGGDKNSFTLSITKQGG